MPPLTNYTGYLLIASFNDGVALHYPTLEEREENYNTHPGTHLSPSPPKLLGLFATQEQAEEYVLEAQRQADPAFFGEGCFAILPVDCFSTTTEIDRGPE